MMANWQGIAQLMGTSVPFRAQHVLAQATPAVPTVQPGAAVQSGVNYVQGLTQSLIQFIPNLIAAILILVVGLVIATLARSLTRGILNRTDIDNKIAAGVMGGRADNRDLPQVENVISGVVFWIIILFTAVAVLQALNLEAVSRPLNIFLNQVIGFLPKLVGAVILLAVAWLVATLVKLVATRGLHALRLDDRVNQQPAGTTREPNQLSLSETVGTALYWFIFLLFLLPILNTLELNQALQPVQSLITQILSILPNILAAVLIGAVGWFVATIVRRIVTNLLTTTGIDQLGTRVGLRRTTGGQTLSGIVGTIVYVLILIPIAIAALNALRIDAISVPAIAMLQQILNVLPSIFTAALVLILAYFLGHFVSDLVTSILTSFGFNNIFSALGLSSVSRHVSPPPRASATRYSDPAEQSTVIQPDTAKSAAAAATPQTPSEIIGVIVFVGIMLFATVAAVNILNIAALTLLVTGIVVILGRILAGLVVFGIGLFLANLAFNIITSSGDSQAMILGQIARIAIIALVSAMALQQIGIASDIVNLAFGLLLGALAVAIALAFGLGGRDIAREQVRELLDSFKQKRNKPPV